MMYWDNDEYQEELDKIIKNANNMTQEERQQLLVKANILKEDGTFTDWITSVED